MEFALSPEQRQMASALERRLGDVAAPATVLSFADGAEAEGDALWETAVALGLPALLQPEAEGGLGLGLLEAALLAEAVGRFAAPLPYAASFVLAPLGLMGAGGAAAAWRARLAAGRARAAISLRPLGREGPARDAPVLREGRLIGEALLVEDARAADLLLIEDEEGALHLVETAGAALSLRPARALDRTRRFFDVAFRGAPALPLAPPGGVARLRSAQQLLLAAETLGAANAMAEKAVAYAGVREQFGRAIGAFQAVKHLCAEMAAEIEPARALVWYAAATLDEALPEGALAAAHAKAHLSEIGRFIARTATEAHGGVGFTHDLGLHLWFKRIEANRQLGGAPEAVRRSAARMLGLLSAAAPA